MNAPTPKGLPQIATFSMQIGANLSLAQSLDITGRDTMLVDRIQAYLRVEPSALGALPVMDTLRECERLIRVRVALDRNDMRVITNGDVPVSLFQQLQGGPLPVPPFQLGGNETPTIKVNYGPNFLLTDPLKNYGNVYLELAFYGQAL
ncbi:MAG TPA: hypothetical protein VF768_04235 [Holophagaceae bacterium]